jgi:hypothetical protein
LVASLEVAAEDFRVEVELDDEAHGYSLRERLRALDLDDEARKRLGKTVVVTRDGSRLFLYALDEPQVRQAERVMRGLVAEGGLSADIRVTRWHPVEEEWKDLAVPLPRTPEDEEAEYEAREAAEEEEAEAEGSYDWQVVLHLRGRGEAHDLAEQLTAEGLPVARRWRYVVVGAVTEEDAEELASRLRSELGDDAEVSVSADISDVPSRPFQFVGF